MSGYLIPAGFGEAEYIVKKSRFISRVWHVGNEDEAIARIKETRERHRDATHNVYAYILREDSCTRYSDDGEPQGTSGLPVLSVFTKAEVFDLCCVVTRYFGGVLLGAGGLTRAYSHAAALALECAGKSLLREWQKLRLVCPYNLFESVRKELLSCGGSIANTSYAAEVEIDAFLPAEADEVFAKRLSDVSSGSLSFEDLGVELMAVNADT